MAPSVDALRQFVVSPRAFFAERPPADTIGVSVVLVVLFSGCLVGGMLMLGSILAGTVDATVTMDNPAHTPSSFCDQPRDDPDSPLYDGCDEPETVERDAGPLLQEAVTEYTWIGIVVPPVLWGAAGAVLYGAGRAAGGTPSFGGALSLAGWATIPEFFRLAVGLVAIRLALVDLTVTDVDQLEAAMLSAFAPIEPILLVASLLTAAWQWQILSGGLAEEADIPWRAAAAGVAVPLGLFVLFNTVV
ncbi:Yip1 family protein [Halohasta litorea]|uniref:Yip1 family protein n=1 Tax=Halohasta litorea TaxID=869891 RepID=A0ABD6D5X1_9EURY|nr:Yip1 family protein [Halohasta litorea]